MVWPLYKLLIIRWCQCLYIYIKFQEGKLYKKEGRPADQSVVIHIMSEISNKGYAMPATDPLSFFYRLLNHLKCNRC